MKMAGPAAGQKIGFARTTQRTAHASLSLFHPDLKCSIYYATCSEIFNSLLQSPDMNADAAVAGWRAEAREHWQHWQCLLSLIHHHSAAQSCVIIHWVAMPALPPHQPEGANPEMMTLTLDSWLLATRSSHILCVFDSSILHFLPRPTPFCAK